jgi:pilus assembly protein CpaF
MDNLTPGPPQPSTPSNATSGEATPLRPTAERPFSDRFAGRVGLDRDVQAGPDSLATTGERPTEASTEPSRAPLARVDSDVAQSEREAKNRALYRRKHLIFDSVLSSIDPRLLQVPTRDTLRPAIEKGVDGSLREFNLNLENAERSWLIEEFLRETTDFGPLVALLDDPGINKILVTGSSDVTIEKLGRIERTGISFRDDDHLLSIIRRLAETVGGRIDAKVPLLDRPLPDGARVRAKIPPMAPQPTLTLEKSSGNPFVVLKRQQAERGRGDNLPYAQLRERIQQRLVREFEGDSISMGNQDRLRAQVEEMINAVILEERVAVTRAERAALVMDLLNEIVGLGPIEPLLNDPEVDEVMVNGPYQIYVERKGKLELSTQRFRDNAHVLQVIERIVAPLGRRVDEKSPMVDGRLRDGSRFNAVIPPLALSGPTMTIRKFARDPFTMTDLINFGTLTRDAAQFLQAAVEGRLNVVVSGGTGSGKTTTLNVLSSFIPTTERIVTIEDAAELQLRQEHVIRLETRPPNIEGIGEVSIRDLVRNALRMRPDRIVIGECRGGEALDMLQAMNTGHDGSLTTGHSNGPRDMLKRLETMVMMAGFDLPVKAIREQVSMAVQIIVHQERMRDGKRRITAITELVGMEGDVITMQDIFRFEQERVDDEGRIIGALVPTGLRPKNFDTILDHGVDISMDLFHPRAVTEPGMRSRMDRSR